MIGTTQLAHICMNHHLRRKHGHIAHDHASTIPKSSMWIALAVGFAASLIAFFGFYLLMIAVLPKGPSLCRDCTLTLTKFSPI